MEEETDERGGAHDDSERLDRNLGANIQQNSNHFMLNILHEYL